MATESVPESGGGEEVPELISRGGPDLLLTYRVARELLADDRRRYRQIAISVQDGVVVLTGRASVPARETAGRIARHIPGIRDVRNLIRSAAAAEAANADGAAARR
jgi:hypothetical protein